jgi:hypothetical protein
MGGVQWSRFLSKWALGSVGMIVALMVAFGGGVGFDSSAPPEYAELVQAGRHPEAYRLAMVLDALNWVMISGFLIGFAGLFWDHAPIRSRFLAAAGMGMVAGVIGGMLRLQGTGEMAVRYAAASSEQQAVLVQSYLVLADSIAAHFQVGQLLQAAGYLLIASVAYAARGIPRWLAVLAACPGLSSAFLFVRNTSEPFSFPLLMIHIVLLIVLYVGVAWAFWRRAPDAELARAPRQAVSST